MFCLNVLHSVCICMCGSFGRAFYRDWVFKINGDMIDQAKLKNLSKGSWDECCIKFEHKLDKANVEKNKKNKYKNK